MKKEVTTFKIITVIIFLLLFSLAGCVEESQDVNKQEIDLIETEIDTPSILPDWKNGEYHDYKATTYKLRNFNKDYPNLVNIFSIGKSVLEKDIWCIKITNEKNDTRKLSCVIDGCIHGSEWEAGEICLYLAEYLLINYGENKTISDILNTTEIYLIPLLNPDGRDKDERWNENGIDLNRNFDVHFARIKGGSFRLGKLFGLIKLPMIKLPRRGIYTNAGRRPFSEPETQALRDLTESLDSGFSLYVNCHTALHSVSAIINIEYKPEFEATSKDKKVFNTALDWIKENTEYNVIHVDNFSHPGGGFANHWIFKKYHIPAFCFELLNMDYEPWYTKGGKHDNLVHWMKASLPVLFYLIANIESFHNWEKPSIDPSFPKGVPPQPFVQKSSFILFNDASVLKLVGLK
jgi:hypothetical protein